ncbi:uncharacterized protein LOC105682079 [Bombus impatiens]|uniref:Uncharacterized protein LOC105682079 n=1 Tax=Bombus impatiens TaxID=132113 RepID=A0A6P3V6M4_BOMIM|nr:uncharacterized protein LOC105682079 [Bombus impatiens]
MATMRESSIHIYNNSLDFRAGSVSSNTKYGYRCSIAMLFSTASTRIGSAENIEVIIPKLNREKSILKEKRFMFCACVICYECLAQKQRYLYSPACLARTKISLSFMLNFQFNRISSLRPDCPFSSFFSLHITFTS